MFIYSEELRNIKDQIEDLMAHAEELVQDYASETGNRMVEARAESYWIPQIERSLNDEDWFSMEATIKEMEEMEES